MEGIIIIIITVCNIRPWYRISRRRPLKWKIVAENDNNRLLGGGPRTSFRQAFGGAVVRSVSKNTVAASTSAKEKTKRKINTDNFFFRSGSYRELCRSSFDFYLIFGALIFRDFKRTQTEPNPKNYLVRWCVWTGTI